MFRNPKIARQTAPADIVRMSASDLPDARRDPDDEALPPKPERPDSSECCKSDCSPCIFEIYDQQLDQWEQRVAQILAQRAARAKND